MVWSTMAGRSTSLQHSLATALAAVDEAAIPAELREAAFKWALEQLAASQSPARGAGAKGDELGDPEHRRQQDASDDDRLAAKVAAALGVDETAIAEVFDVDDEFALTVSPSALPSSQKEALADIAYLVCAARQASGLDDGLTEPAKVKATAADTGIEDNGNFWKAMDAVKNQGIVVKGTGRDRKFKVNRRGLEIAGSIVLRITGRDE